MFVLYLIVSAISFLVGWSLGYLLDCLIKKIKS